MDKICEYCGQMMYNVRADKKYCSCSCSRKASRQRQQQGVNARQKICPHCGEIFIIQDNGWNRRYCYKCVPHSNVKENGAQTRQRIKQWALEYKGNKCEICGYNKCSEALDFHHTDMSQKEFNLSDRDLICDWSQIRLELDKCMLVCANCHREIHANMNRKGE